jgi:hypothetical protein
MASICNDERVAFGVMSGHERKTLRLSGFVRMNRAGGSDMASGQMLGDRQFRHDRRTPIPLKSSS